jgi:hypothetical protein
MLDAALAEYQKKTGGDLLAHWLAAEVQNCESVDAVLHILRDQAKAFERSDDQRLMKWIDPLVHVLYTFSGALGDGVSVVLITNPSHVMWFLTLLLKAFPPAKVIFTGIGVLLGVRVLSLPFVDLTSLTLEFYRRRRMSEQVTVLSSIFLSASRAFSSVSRFILKFP